MKSTEQFSKLKAAELLSLSGAGVLGTGIGLLLVRPLGAYALPILLLGGICHWIGMRRKHQLETANTGSQPTWYLVLYWLCWALLVAVLLVVAVSLLSSYRSA